MLTNLYQSSSNVPIVGGSIIQKKIALFSSQTNGLLPHKKMFEENIGALEEKIKNMASSGEIAELSLALPLCIIACLEF